MTGITESFLYARICYTQTISTGAWELHCKHIKRASYQLAEHFNSSGNSHRDLQANTVSASRFCLDARVNKEKNS